MYKNMDKNIQPEVIQSDRKSSVEPKKTFIKPKLVKHGDVKDITASGNLGSFYQ